MVVVLLNVGGGGGDFGRGCSISGGRISNSKSSSGVEV